MDVDNKIVELRYQETMKAITLWVKEQKGKGSRDEALGIAKAFLSQASIAFAVCIPGCDESDAQGLLVGFMKAVKQFAEEKIAEGPSSDD